MPNSRTILDLTIPAWATMWSLGAFIFFAVKLATISTVHGWRWANALSYTFLTPTLDPAPFVGVRREKRVDDRCWTALVAIVCAVLIWILVVPATRPLSNWLAGFSAMAGGICFLHYGVFRLLTALMQLRGRAVRPIMNDPWQAHTLANFWGQRWNTAFRDASQRLIVRPLRGRISPRSTMWVVFLASGLIHDLVISLPVGGYGQPTIYFLIQAVGMTSERSKLLRERLALSRFRGFAWTALWLVVPLPLLFHAPFCVDVILPFYDRMSAIISTETSTTPRIEHLIWLGGFLQLSILLASAATPFLLDWKTMLAEMPKLLRQMFWVYGAYIVLTIVALGSMSIQFSRQLSDPSHLTACLLSFTALFWSLRLAIGVVGFDSEPYLTTEWHRFGYAMLNLAFVILSLLYTTLAIRTWQAV